MEWEMLIRTSILNLLMFLCFFPSSGRTETIDVAVRILDSEPTHVHPPGNPFNITVEVESPKSGADVFCQWVDPADKPLSAPMRLTPGQKKNLQSPSSEVGHYRLHISSPDRKVRFPPQEVGYPTDYGFSILPSKSVSNRKLNTASPFGMIHADINDPYLEGHIKTITWNLSPRAVARRIRAARSFGLEETLLIVGDGWKSPNGDRELITSKELAKLGAKLGAILDQVRFRGLEKLDTLQVGLEENKGDMFKKRYFIQNLEIKIARIHEELAKRRMATKVMINTRGVNQSSLKEVRAILESGAAKYIDILSHNPYFFDAFPSPEGWLKKLIETINGMMSNVREGPKSFAIGELGIPVRGNNNPDGFFGYPRDAHALPGATMLYQAKYLVKSHILSLATTHVDRIYLYNYQNRGNDINYAEHHFGIRSFAKHNAKGHRLPGYPLPSYNAYATMIDQLGSGMRFSREDRVGKNVFVFEFQSGNTPSHQNVIVAWVYPDGEERVSLDSLSKGLSRSDIVQVIDLFGTPVELKGTSIQLDGKPLYIKFVSKDSVARIRH